MGEEKGKGEKGQENEDKKIRTSNPQHVDRNH